jgi:hypothetical protein
LTTLLRPSPNLSGRAGDPGRDQGLDRGDQVLDEGLPLRASAIVGRTANAVWQLGGLITLIARSSFPMACSSDNPRRSRSIKTGVSIRTAKQRSADRWPCAPIR